MSDGDGRDSSKFLSERENQRWNRKKKKLGADEFAQAIARIAVTQICENLGFQSFQQSALDCLADVGVRHIREIGKTANSYANLANRSQCNVFDVIQGLEDLGSVQGFSGSSDINHPLSESGVVKDIIRYVDKEDEIPFAYLTPVFPVVKERTSNPSFAQAGEHPPDEHIPSWLPKFPNPETYANLRLENEKHTETEVVNKNQSVDEQYRKVDEPLLNFQQKNGFEGVVEQEDNSKTQEVEDSNPFLLPPLQYGEKEVFLPVLPDKYLDGADYYKRSEALENKLTTPEPSLGQHENVTSGPCEPAGDRRKVLLNGRPSLQFKFGNGKKTLESIEKVSVWFGEDRDENNIIRKRRADKILREDRGFQPEAPHL
ncbi:hypothetical protein OROHE_026183 [Orobanche hederae]